MFLVVPPLVAHPVRRRARARERRRLDGACAGGALPAASNRRRRDRPEGDGGGAALPRPRTHPRGCASSPRTRAHTSASTDKRYDVIAIDVYRQPYIPFQVTTREFFSDVRSHLTPGGGVALNVARLPGDRGLLDAVAATVRDRVRAGVGLGRAALQHAALRACNAPVTRAELVSARRRRSRPAARRSCRSSGATCRRPDSTAPSSPTTARRSSGSPTARSSRTSPAAAGWRTTTCRRSPDAGRKPRCRWSPSTSCTSATST